MAKDKMRVAAVSGLRQVEIREIARPRPDLGEIMIRTKACALCTVDQRVYLGIDKKGRPLPFAGGHEYAGVVEEIGDRTRTDLQVGNSVTVRPHRVAPYEGLSGSRGLAEYKVAPVDVVYKLSDDLPFEEGALSEPLSCAVHAQFRLGIQLAEDVLVIGAGTMGLLNMLVAKTMGAKVIVSELDAARRKKAKDLGANVVVNPTEVDIGQAVRAATGGRGADAVIVAIGNAAANRQALQAVGRRGRVTFFASAHPPEDVCVDPNYLHNSQVVITGAMGHDDRSFPVAVKLLSDGLIDVGPLIEAMVPLDKIKDAFELAIRPDTHRVVVTF